MLETLSDDDYVNVVYVSIIKPSTRWALGGLFVWGGGEHDARWEKGQSDRQIQNVRMNGLVHLHAHSRTFRYI